jgi:hypothetical protein
MPTATIRYTVQNPRRSSRSRQVVLRSAGRSHYRGGGGLSEWQEFLVDNAGKGWTIQRMAREYRKSGFILPSNYLKCDYKMNSRGEIIENCRPTGRRGYSGLDDIEETEELEMLAGGSGISRRLRQAAMLDLDFDDMNTYNAVDNSGVSFIEGFLGPKPETRKPTYARTPDQYCSKNFLNGGVKGYETAGGKCIKPKADLVFNALHKKCGWMQIPSIKAAKYVIWRDRLEAKYNYNPERITFKLNKIIKDNQLNPSERTGVAVGTMGNCEGENCFFNPITRMCERPTAQAFFDCKYSQNYLNRLSPVQQANLRLDSEREFNAMPDKCAWFKRNGFNMNRNPAAGGGGGGGAPVPPAGGGGGGGGGAVPPAGGGGGGGGGWRAGAPGWAGAAARGAYVPPTGPARYPPGRSARRDAFDTELPPGFRPGRRLSDPVGMRERRIAANRAARFAREAAAAPAGSAEAREAAAGAAAAGAEAAAGAAPGSPAAAAAEESADHAADAAEAEAGSPRATRAAEASGDAAADAAEAPTTVPTSPPAGAAAGDSVDM